LTEVLKDLNTKGSENIILDPANPDQVIINFDNITFNIPTDLPNLILIDEVTHFDAIELALLNEVIKRAKIGTEKQPGIFTKIIAAGDPTQMGATSVQHKDLLYNVDWVSGTFLPQLTLTVRALNTQKRLNNDAIGALTRKAINIYRDEDSMAKVLNLIGNGVPIKYFLDQERFHGDIVTSSATLPKDILSTIKKAIDKKPNIKIGILSASLALDPALKASLDAAGITESNYKVYTSATIQGSEADYFIVSTSDIAGVNIVRSLRKLYTYTSRAKVGTIILNTGEIKNSDGSILKILSDKQDFTEEVAALDPILVRENKESRQADLEKLLTPDFETHYDNFSFNNKGVILNDTDPIRGNNFTNEPEGSRSTDELIQILPGQKIQDDFKYMTHSFYNDLNVSYPDPDQITGNSITISKNPNSTVSYGLDYLFNEATGNSITMPLAEFNEIASNYINLKYTI